MRGFWNHFFERLDLGGFWNYFFEMFGQNAKKAKNAKKCKKTRQTRTQSQMARLPRVGGRRCSPPGVSIRRPPKVCEACWTIITSPFRYVQIKSQRANLKGQALYASLGSCSPLFFSPQEAGDHRNPPLNLRVLRLVGCLGLIFCSSDTLFKNDIEKTSKKTRKSRILNSKTLPKSF